MASSRDDFIIAIRSAFLKKSTQQKFSLLTLVFVSIFVILLSSFDFKIIRYLKMGINEVVYRSSFIVSIPENLLQKTSKETGLPVHVADDPLSCVAVGTGKALDQEETFSTMLSEY